MWVEIGMDRRAEGYERNKKPGEESVQQMFLRHVHYKNPQDASGVPLTIAGFNFPWKIYRRTGIPARKSVGGLLDAKSPFYTSIF